MNFERACRKYEEALSIFKYYYSTNPKWNEQGIDDDELREVEDFGKDDFQKEAIRKIKVDRFLSMAICNIKSQHFDIAV